MLTVNENAVEQGPAEVITNRPGWTAKLRHARAWFASFRKTRPFWGGLWMVFGGWLIVRLSAVSYSAAISAGITGSGGLLTGGGLIIAGFLVWAVPTQRYVASIMGLLLAIASLIVSNLGGFFIGMFFGIIGSAMALSWGPKKPRRRVQTDAAAASPEAEDADQSEGIPA